MKVLLGVSNKHIHLNKEDYDKLFGNIKMEKYKDLKQPGMYASNLFVDIKTEKNKLEKLRIVGPIRDYTQVELSKTDCYKLGINPPVRNSGDLEGASIVTIIGPNGEVTKPCAIIAARHIHVTKEMREKYNLNTDIVKVKILGKKPTILENVYIKESKEAFLELHLDTDDANATLSKTGDMIEILMD